TPDRHDASRVADDVEQAGPLRDLHHDVARHAVDVDRARKHVSPEIVTRRARQHGRAQQRVVLAEPRAPTVSYLLPTLVNAQPPQVQSARGFLNLSRKAW